jgi:hypothetical protein
MRYLLIFCLSLSLMLNPKPARAEFSSAVLAVGIVIGIVIAEISHSNNSDKDSEESN